MVGAADRAVFARAAAEDRTVITRDGDFAGLWELMASGKPSVVLIRVEEASPARLAKHLIAQLAAAEADLLAGAIAVLEETGWRIRRRA